MHAVLEYLAIGILVVVALLAVSQMVEAPSRTVEAVKAEQLFTVAERLMDKILLTPGYPPDWGSNFNVTPDELKDFGVALAGAVAPYVVDPDKVMRLANLTPLPNPVPISAERIAELLGIKGSYGFRLEMRPMIEITTIPLEKWGELNIISKLQVNVRNWEGVGLPNAKVTVLNVIANKKGVGTPEDRGQPNQDKIFEQTPLKGSCITGFHGSCIIDFSHDLSRIDIKGPNVFSFIIMHVSWEGFVSVAGFSPDDLEQPVAGYIIGDVVFVERSDRKHPGAVILEDEVVHQVIPHYAILLESTDVEWCEGEPPVEGDRCHEVAARVLPSPDWAYDIGILKSLDILSSHVVIFGMWRGRWRAVVISRIPIVDIQFGPRNVKPANSVTLTRLALIYNYPYIVRLTIWRWTEGWP